MTAALNSAQTVISIASTNVYRVPGIAKLQYAVWGNANGQNDLIWYTANPAGNGSYRLDVNVSNHKEAGAYNVHAYATLTNGTSVFIASASVNVPQPKPGAVLTGQNINPTAGTFQVKASSLKSPPGIVSAKIAVWSNANQSDLRWYPASRQGDGSYLLNVSIANHSYNFGTYNAHMYVVCSNGIEVFAGAASIVITQPAANMTAALNSAQTVISIASTNVYRVPGIAKLQYAVWGNANGQNDIRWYTANPTGNGSYRLDVNVSNHREAGAYNIHAYATLTNGASVFIAAKSVNVPVPPAVASLHAQNINSSAGRFQIRAVHLPVGVSNARIAIWSTANQSDLKWYPAKLHVDGSYTVDVSIANHGNRRGKYNAHMYVTCANGIEAYMGQTVVTI
jgi:hypothetical protein